MSEEKKNGIGVAGFVLAIVTLLIGWIPVIGWIIGAITWLLGLIFSAVGIAKAKKVKKGMGLSIAGLVISLLGIILALLTGALGAMALM